MCRLDMQDTIGVLIESIWKGRPGKEQVMHWVRKGYSMNRAKQYKRSYKDG